VNSVISVRIADSRIDSGQATADPRYPAFETASVLGRAKALVRFLIDPPAGMLLAVY
jgi:hypothetical protein